jgi:hypothetical protein
MRVTTILESRWGCGESIDIHRNRKGRSRRGRSGRGREGMRWDREMIRLRKWGRFMTFILAFNFSLVKVSIDLDNGILPCSESIQVIDDADKVVLDSRLKTLHKAINFGLLSHVKMGGEFEEASQIVESWASLAQVIKSLVSSESKSRVGKLLLELRSKELPVQENRRFGRLEVTEPLNRNAIFKIETVRATAGR